MNEQIVEFVATDRTTELRPIPDAYQFRSDRGWKWIQKLAIWTLRKLGCYAVQEFATFTRHRIDTKTLIDNIIQQNLNLMEFYHFKGERLLIGSEDFYQLMGQELNHHVTFDARYHWGENGQTYIMGMKVTVIPWMKGILVLPKEGR